MTLVSIDGGDAMTKSELIDEVRKAKGVDLTKKATEAVVDAVFQALASAIKKDGRFSYPGFGTFVVKQRGERKGRNPKTGEPMVIPAKKTVTFKPAPKFKALIQD